MLAEEKNLVSRAKTGEAEAFGQLYDHYLPKIYRFILFRVDGEATAEDLTHEVFLNAWKGIDNYEITAFPFGSWLYRIARNKVIDYYKTNKVYLAIEKVKEGDPVLPATLAIESDLDIKMGLERIRRALRELSEDQQTVIIMRFVDDLSHAEIAAVLGRSEGTTRVIQHNALKNLRKILRNPKS